MNRINTHFDWNDLQHIPLYDIICKKKVVYNDI
jgi:hypothetical protein